jgi:type III secretion system FlhB-like substrate exporter
MHRHTKRLCQVVATGKGVSCEYVTQTARDFQVCVRSVSSHAMLKEGLRLEGILQNLK